MCAAKLPSIHIALMSKKTNYAIVLSNNELGRIFGDGAIWKPSQSSTLVYVPWQAVWYKYSYEGTCIPPINMFNSAWYQIEIYWASYIVNFEFVAIESLVFLRYKAMPHDPLTVEEARLCLHDLLKGLAQEIQEFHQHGFCIPWLACVLTSSMNLFRSVQKNHTSCLP